MDELGASRVTPQLRPEDADMPILSWIDPDNFNPNYLMRGLHLLPNAATSRSGCTRRTTGPRRTRSPQPTSTTAAFATSSGFLQDRHTCHRRSIAEMPGTGTTRHGYGIGPMGAQGGEPANARPRPSRGDVA